MESQVLVAYATRYGSTEETARIVASILTAEGLSVEVHSVEEIPACKPYSAVVLAAALYIGKLHKKARRFLKRWRSELEQVPVALIVPGPVSSEAKDFASAQAQLEKQLARFPWLRPITRKIVGGKWDPAKIGFPFRWTLRNQPARDARDWPAIRAFARELAGKLEPFMMR